MLRLYTFTISHFSEKARWALDWNGVAYEEKRLVPGAHFASVRRKAKGTSVPVLEHDGTVVQGSSDILDYLEQKLEAKKLATSAARAREVEALADRAFGLGTQRIFYDVLLNHRDAVVDLWSQGGPFWARPFYTLSWRFLSPAVRKMYKSFPKPVEEARDLFMKTFDETDRMLEGKPYLFGDRPTRVDVTVAALLAPTCQPQEHILRWPSITPPPLDDYLRQLEGRPTFDFVLRMYREHRRVVMSGP